MNGSNSVANYQLLPQEPHWLVPFWVGRWVRYQFKQISLNTLKMNRKKAWKKVSKDLIRPTKALQRQVRTLTYGFVAVN